MWLHQWVSVGLCRILGKLLTIFHYIKKILNYLLKDKAPWLCPFAFPLNQDQDNRSFS